MRSTLKTLKEYQDVLIRIAELDRLLAFVPPEIEGLESEWTAIKDRIEALENKKTEQEQQLKELKASLEETTQKSQKFEKDLHEVTNNKEYHAVLKEIDTAKKKIHSLNEKISQGTTELDEINRNLEECTQLEKESKAKYEEAMSEYKSSQSENQSERKEKITIKETLVKGVPDRVLKKFNRISERRNGVGLALCISSVCGSCNVRVRQNIVDELRKFDTIIHCESCKRILYFAEADEN